MKNEERTVSWKGFSIAFAVAVVASNAFFGYVAIQFRLGAVIDPPLPLMTGLLLHPVWGIVTLLCCTAIEVVAIVRSARRNRPPYLAMWIAVLTSLAAFHALTSPLRAQWS